MDSIDGAKVKYIVIELVLHPDKLEKAGDGMDDVIKFGLFKGISKLAEPQTQQEFILVKPPKTANTVIDDKSMKAYAWDSYNVLSFEVFDGSVRHIAFFKAEDDDQKIADEMVRKVLDKMRDAGRMEADNKDFIDVKSYTQVPSAFSDPIKTTVSRGTQGAFHGQKSTPGVGYGGGTTHRSWSGGHTTTTTDYTRKPFFFRRKSKPPHHSTLKKLFATLDKMDAGDYIEPEWPPIPKEADELDQDKTAAGAWPADRDEHPWQNGCGY